MSLSLALVSLHLWMPGARFCSQVWQARFSPDDQSGFSSISSATYHDHVIRARHDHDHWALLRPAV